MSLDWWSAIVAPTQGLVAGEQAGRENYVALPRRRSSSMLIDASLDDAIGAAVARTSAGVKRPEAIARSFAAKILQVPTVRRRLPLGVHVADGTGQTLRESMAAAMQQPVRLAMTAGPVRPNRKPVARLHDDDGTVCAFAKVAWDSATDALVSTEAAMLEALAASPIDGITVPDVVFESSWQQHTVLATAPLPLSTDPQAVLTPELDALASIANHRGRRSAALVDTQYWNTLRSRLPDDAALLDNTERRSGSTVVALGLLHGDWSPWNAARGADEVLMVWDWERARTDAPIGMDLAHYTFQLERFLRGADVSDAAPAVIDVLGRDLGALDVDPGHAALLVEVELLETLARMHESGLRARLSERAEAIRATLLAMGAGPKGIL